MTYIPTGLNKASGKRTGTGSNSLETDVNGLDNFLLGNGKTEVALNKINPMKPERAFGIRDIRPGEFKKGIGPLPQTSHEKGILGQFGRLEGKVERAGGHMNKLFVDDMLFRNVAQEVMKGTDFTTAYLKAGVHFNYAEDNDYSMAKHNRQVFNYPGANGVNIDPRNDQDHFLMEFFTEYGLMITQARKNAVLNIVNNARNDKQKADVNGDGKLNHIDFLAAWLVAGSNFKSYKEAALDLIAKNDPMINYDKINYNNGALYRFDIRKVFGGLEVDTGKAATAERKIALSNFLKHPELWPKPSGVMSMEETHRFNTEALIQVWNNVPDDPVEEELSEQETHNRDISQALEIKKQGF